MKNIAIAATASVLLAIVLPSTIGPAIARPSSSHLMMKRVHHVHHGRAGGRMPGHRTF